MSETGAKGAAAPATTAGTATPAGSDLVTELRSALGRANELTQVLEANLRETQERQRPDERSDEKIEELERRLATAESDVKELASRLVDSEHQAGRLMNLYVATYQLHATLDPAEVQETIAEIAINLLGAARFVLLLKRDDGGDLEIALNQGIYGQPEPPFTGDSYHGGDPMVDATLADGVLRLGPTAESPALAAVPLRVQNDIVGALVVLKLLDHKPILRAEDRDLLDLLSAHAAIALFAARLFATKDRKLRTLESLVKLARGE
ncbi:MAG TPA: GAF domain-containing protein [Thermoanaerobaculia bacterium]|nr:GAF domain-containing protein [Thermoanaerobaculia bacterium]